MSESTNTKPVTKVIKKQYILSPLEFYKYQLEQTINYKHRVLNDTDLLVLAYIHVYGKEFGKELLKDRILTHANSVTNYLGNLVKSGFAIKIYDESDESKRKAFTDVKVNPQITILDDSFVQITQIIKDETSEEVYSKNYRN